MKTNHEKIIMGAQELSQRMMLATWLVELFLAKLNQLEDVAASEGKTEDADNMRTEFSIIEDDLRDFLKTHKDNLDPKTTFDLLSNQGRTALILHFAELIGDYEKVINHWLFEEVWPKAIDALNRQDNLELFYRYAPVLLRQAPKATVESLMRRNELSVKRLIPGLLQIHPLPVGTTTFYIRYLKYCITDLHNTDTSVHNAYINLLSTSTDSDETELVQYLSNSPDNPITGRPFYNLDYALRLCQANQRVQSCVQIYSKMGLFTSSVELALQTGDIELAKLNADRPEDDDQLRKRLWLKIAKHVVGNKQDIKSYVLFNIF